MSTNSTKKRVLFLDIDGPMIPYRAAFLPDQTNVMTKFDPIAVAMINKLCEKRPDLKIVLHTSWVHINGGEETLNHCVDQGIKRENFYEPDPYVNETIMWRYNRIAEWLERHPEVTGYVIIDDTPYEADSVGKYEHPQELNSRIVLIDYNDGITINKYEDIMEVLEEHG